MEKEKVDSKYRNEDLEHNTNAIQEEFDNLMEEMMNNRKDRDAGGFYKVMDQYYGRGPKDEKYASPTKRLIKQKNSAYDHKKMFHRSISKGEYSLNYTSSPGKSYVIQPHDGEINYKLAEKNPE